MKLLKTLSFAILLGTLLFSTKAHAQSHNHIIKANPIGLAVGNFNVTYEKVISSSSSVLFTGSYMYKLLGEEVNVGGIGAGYRYYFTHSKTEVPSGFWVTPNASLAFGNIMDNGTAKSVSVFAIGAEVGYQWAMKNGFVIDLGIGPNYAVASGNNLNIETSSGITPSLTLAIGYAF